MRRLIAALAVIALLVLAGAAAWQRHRRNEAEMQLGLDAARIVSATLHKASALKVAELTGLVLAKTEAQGCLGLCHATQVTRAPFAVGYFVDLGRLTPRSYRWNPRTRTMSVDVPEVTVAPVAIDMARAQTQQGGPWISRAMGVTLQRQVAGRLAGKAAERARRPDYLRSSREDARDAIEQLVATPLRAAGLGPVTVVIRFPDEARPPELSKEQWDRSRSLAEVLDEAMR